MITEFFKKIEHDRTKQLQRLVRREFYASLRDIEAAVQNPSLRGHDVLPELTDACLLLCDHDMAPADPAAARRMATLTRAALAKTPDWYHVGDDAWNAFVAVDPSLVAQRIEREKSEKTVLKQLINNGPTPV